MYLLKKVRGIFLLAILVVACADDPCLQHSSCPPCLEARCNWAYVNLTGGICFQVKLGPGTYDVVWFPGICPSTPLPPTSCPSCWTPSIVVGAVLLSVFASTMLVYHHRERIRMAGCWSWVPRRPQYEQILDDEEVVLWESPASTASNRSGDDEGRDEPRGPPSTPVTTRSGRVIRPPTRLTY